MQPQNRRVFFRHATVLAAAFTTPGAFAQTLTETFKTGEGPFYPDRMPLDTDNDLLVLNNTLTPAVGQITHLTGRLLTSSGQPIRNASIEVWQVDNNGSYIHKDGANDGKRDANFQGYGRFLTASTGQYYFRTIKPISYTLQGQFRTAHIHFAISRNGQRVFTTQLHVKGHPDNARDFVLERITDPRARESVLAEFRPVENSKVGELSANFDIILGTTSAL
jgi:protocatechuate 3,4-dioxygenase beta subunit